jgi:endonuclease/exonuclease/phosphatase family metal-dependent hydrolase
MTLRIATFNMRGGGSLQHWAELVDAFGPDLVFAQETRDPLGFQPDLLRSLDFSGVLWTPVAHGRWGSAVLARVGPVRPVPIDGFDGWVVGGELRIAGEDMHVYSVHLPPTDGSYVKSAHRMLDALAPVVARARVLLGGDWNLTVGRRREGEPRTNRPGEIELLDRLERDFGVVPAWCTARPGKPLPQTLRWMREPTAPYHCDGVFLPEPLAQAITHVAVPAGQPWERLSDHNPVLVEVAVAGQGER